MPLPRLLRSAVGAILTALSCAQAAPVALDLPAQSAADTLLAISRAAGIEVIFPFDDLRATASGPVRGRLEPEEALGRALAGTGFAAQRYARGKFIVRSAAADLTIALAGSALATRSDARGAFLLAGVPPGRHRLLVTGDGYQPLQLEQVEVEANRVSKLADQRLAPAREAENLEPFVVRGRSARLRPLDDSAALLGPRRATGNLDLPRSENDALPFLVYSREQILRSGVVALNEFLQRAILEGDATTLPPEQSASFGAEEVLVGSSNLKLRGYGENETVILVNGRRLPEIQTSVPPRTLPPDVNFIPLSLIQQVEVLPASASALYSGNPVGGVINIVLRPDVTATEVSATYTNALRGYDAPQTSVSLQHGQSLLGGSLRLRLNAVFTAAEPPTEAELGLRRTHAATLTVPDDRLFRATPHVRSSDGSPLFGAGSPTFTSVAPGADGRGGLAAFAGRAGVRNLAFFDSPGTLSASPTSLDAPYGRRQRRTVWFGSLTWDPRPWVQLGLDVTHSATALHRGLDVLTAELVLPAASPLNPFGRAVTATLADTAPRLGTHYSEARIGYDAAVGGVLLRLPSDWRLSFDAQFARNEVRYRGLAGADPDRWQELVATGRYQPLRDTQVFGPPDAFYDEVLLYRGGRDQFVTIGDYRTLDLAARVSNQSLALPTGRGTVITGIDYRRLELADYREAAVYADGTPAADPVERRGRTLERYSFFGEILGPLLPAPWRPAWLGRLDADLAVRHVTSANANEVNTAPTLGLRAELAGGWTLRGSVTTSNRFPTPQLSRPLTAPGGPAGGLNREIVYDPRRNQAYEVVVDEAIDPGLPPEDAVTQTAGLIFTRGDDHRFRASLDFVDTRKTNEILALDAQTLVNVEAVFPDRVTRASAAPGEPADAGPITRLITGSVNASWRHSQNWNAAVEYAWSGCLGGTLELRSRLLYYSRYERQLFANSPVVDQITRPDGTEPALMRYRANLGASWSNRRFGFGLDGQYFHSRRLPVVERPSQGAAAIRPYWQLDAFVQADLGRWLPWTNPRHGLRAQLRVNNLTGFDYPRYANHGSGTGLQPYGDWRGRTYSVSVTAAF